MQVDQGGSVGYGQCTLTHLLDKKTLKNFEKTVDKTPCLWYYTIRKNKTKPKEIKTMKTYYKLTYINMDGRYDMRIETNKDEIMKLAKIYKELDGDKVKLTKVTEEEIEIE